MNISIVFNHLVAKLNLNNNINYRPLIDVQHGFGLYDINKQKLYIDKPLNELIKFLRDNNQIKGPIKVLKKNVARARVVFSVNDVNGCKIVVKWFNPEAPCTFNFSGSIEMEKYVHGNVSTMTESFIPKLLFSNKNYIAVEFADGKLLSNYFLNSENDYINFKKAIKFLLNKLKVIYQKTSKGVFDTAQFNNIIMREHHYMRQVSEKKSYKEIFSLAILKTNLEKKYIQFIQKAGLIFSDRKTPWTKSLCLMDLDLYNILYDKHTQNVWMVDVEDAYEGNFIFDIAWLSSRIYLLNNPLISFNQLNNIFLTFIRDMDLVDSDKSIALYKALLGAYLTIGIINPCLNNFGYKRKIYHIEILQIIDVINH